MPKKLTSAQLRQIGTAPTFYSEIEDGALDEDNRFSQEYINYRHALEASRLVQEQDDRILPMEHDEAEYAMRAERDDAALAGRVWPTTLLYRYLVPPLRDTVLELLEGRRVGINLLKLLGAAIVISAVVLAAFYFPPLVAFFAAHAITSAAAIGVIGSLATGAIYVSNEIVKGIETLSKKLHWDRYECHGTQVRFWNKNYKIKEPTLQQMNAYLINKLYAAKSQDYKGMLSRLLEKFEISKKQDVHAVGLFFAEELKILLKTRAELQYMPPQVLDGAKSPEEVAERLKAIKIQLDADISAVTHIVNALRKAPSMPTATKNALDNAYDNIAKQRWSDDVNNQFKHLGDLIAKSEHQRKAQVLAAPLELHEEPQAQAMAEPKAALAADIEVKVPAAPAALAPAAVQGENDMAASYKKARENLRKLEVEGDDVVLRMGGKKVVLDRKEDYPQVIEWLRKIEVYKAELQPPLQPEAAETESLVRLRQALGPKPR